MNTQTLRFFQKKIQSLQEKIIFKTSHISTWGKLSLFWVFICFVSLFISWGWSFWNTISSENVKIYDFSSFSPIMWYIGFFILSWISLAAFSISSIQKKQKFKYFSLLELRDYSCTIIVGLIVFLWTLHSFFIIIWLKIFSSNITHSNGIILCMTWSIIMIIWGIVIRKEYRMNIKWSYINDSERSPHFSEHKDKKGNMKLPF